MPPRAARALDGGDLVSHFDYQLALSAGDVPFDTLIMAAVLRADTRNATRLAVAFPELYAETQARYNAPGGVLDTDGGTS